MFYYQNISRILSIKHFERKLAADRKKNIIICLFMWYMYLLLMLYERIYAICGISFMWNWNSFIVISCKCWGQEYVWWYANEIQNILSHHTRTRTRTHSRYNRNMKTCCFFSRAFLKCIRNAYNCAVLFITSNDLLYWMQPMCNNLKANQKTVHFCFRFLSFQLESDICGHAHI